MRLVEDYKGQLLIEFVKAEEALLIADYISDKKELNFQDPKGRTALIWAINLENKEIVEMLVNAGADLQIRDNQGHTAISLAQEKRNLELINILSSSLSEKSNQPAK